MTVGESALAADRVRDVAQTDLVGIVGRGDVARAGLAQTARKMARVASSVARRQTRPCSASSASRFARRCASSAMRRAATS